MAELNEFFGDEGFDPSKVKGGSVVPAGEYRVCITGSSVEESKNTPGARYIKFELTILQPAEMANRKMWKIVNIGHPKDNVRQIAQQELKQICEAVGLTRITRTDELHNKAMLIRVEVKPRDGNPDDLQNEIKRFSRVVIGQPSSPQTGETVTPVAPGQKFF